MSVLASAETKPFWSFTVSEALRALRAGEDGLTQEEVINRQKYLGRNVIAEEKDLKKIRLFLRQFKSPLIVILVAAAVITIGLKEFVNAAFILGAISVITVLGFIEENKADVSLRRLKKYIRRYSIVERAGGKKKIESEDLVIGDIIHLYPGDRVPADARLTASENLQVDQSALTGESLPAAKNAREVQANSPLIDQTCMVFASSLVVDGRGKAVVTQVGARTELGRIMALVMKTEEETTPLEDKILHLTVWLGVLLIVLTIGLFAAGVGTGYSLYDILLISVAVAVASVPESLPVALTVILAKGVEHLAKRKGVVRKLLAAETLGATSIILTDKTGTLTEAKMKLVEVKPVKAEDKHFLLEASVLNIQVIIENPDVPPEKWILHGSPLGKALLLGAADYGVSAPKINARVLERLSFNPVHKYSAVLFDKDGSGFLCLLGAPEIILEKCSLVKEEREEILGWIGDRAAGGARVLGAAWKVAAPSESVKTGLAEKDFTFLGILSFRDPVRPGVKDAVRLIETAGIRTVIVTGDHRGTAEAVARELNFDLASGLVLDGHDLEMLSDRKLIAKLPFVRIFSRVTPEGKLRIVRAYKERGEVVAMTGDGVNDAPALKEADIGVAVGSGTEVAKEASDLVLLDDNFETLVAAVEEGRRIILNVRKVFVYLLVAVFDELCLIAGSILTGLPLPLNTLQILWVNFFSESFPAMAFSFDRSDENVLQSKPKSRDSFLDGELKWLIFGFGLFSSALLFFLYFWLVRAGYEIKIVKTFIYFCFSLYSLFLVYPLRQLNQPIFRYNPFSNLPLNIAVLLGMILIFAGVYLPPLETLFDTVPLSAPWFLAVAGFVIFNLLIVEVIKWFYRPRSKI